MFRQKNSLENELLRKFTQINWRSDRMIPDIPMRPGNRIDIDPMEEGKKRDEQLNNFEINRNRVTKK